jgi:hypothetical protein
MAELVSGKQFTELKNWSFLENKIEIGFLSGKYFPD